jgi:ubiquinone biosynthesis protein
MGRLLGQLLTMAQAFEMRQQPELILLQKTIVVAEGLGRRLNPAVNIWQLAQPLVEGWVIANLGPQARLRDGLADAADALARLPEVVRLLETRLREDPVGKAAEQGSRLGRGLLVPLLVLAAGVALGLVLAG